MTTIAEAKDEMFGHAKASLPGGFDIAYPDIAFSSSGKTQWARVTLKHVDGGQRGFGDNRRKFLSIGILCVEIFVQVGDGGTDLDTLAQNVKTYLEDVSSSQVWYRNIRAANVDPDGGFNKINIYADFEYENCH